MRDEWCASIAAPSESVAGRSESVAGLSESVAGLSKSVAGGSESTARWRAVATDGGEPATRGGESVARYDKPFASDDEFSAPTDSSISATCDVALGSDDSRRCNGECGEHEDGVALSRSVAASAFMTSRGHIYYVATEPK